ncbi:MAG: hypothetical protein ABR564_02275 [Candidatus Dormibacteria bacterium]
MAWAKTLAAILLGHGTAPGPGADTAADGSPAGPPLLLDAGTRTFWSQGAVAPATLVETGAGPRAQESATRRISAMVAARESRPGPAGRPRGNPAFSEAVFVELMRARQYSRAFELLTTECQGRWGSVEAFAAEHAGGVLGRLQGVEVKEVRFLPEWTDPELLIEHREVAELDVEYSLLLGEGPIIVTRTVHLVAVAGKWRSVCYPQARPRL